MSARRKPVRVVVRVTLATGEVHEVTVLRRFYASNAMRELPYGTHFNGASFRIVSVAS